MKTKAIKFMAMAIMALSAFSLTCCSDDDEEEVYYVVESTPAEDIEGTYSGYTTVIFTYISLPYAYADQTLTLTANDDGTATLSYSNDTWGDYEADDIEVTENSDGSYTLSGTGEAYVSGHSSSSTAYEATIAGTIDSDGNMELSFSMSFMGTTTVTFISGDCPAALLIQGDHSGYATVDFTYISTPYVYTDQTLTLTASDDYSTLSLSYENDTWGTYEADDITITENSDGTFTLDGTATAAISGHSSSSTAYEAAVTGTAESDGTITELTFTMSFMGTTTVSFYEGDCPDAYAVADDYSGTFTLYAYGTAVGAVSDLGITIAAEDVDAGTVSLTVSSFDITAMGMAMTIGEIAVSGVSVSANDDGGYDLSCSSVSVEGVSCTIGTTESTYDVTVSLSGTINSDGSASITFSELNLGAMALSATYVVEASSDEE